MTRTTSAAALRQATDVDFGKRVNFNAATSVITYTTPAALQSTTNDYTLVQAFTPRTVDGMARRIIDQSNAGLIVILTGNGLQVQARHGSTNGQIIVPPSTIRANELNTLIVGFSNTMNYPQVYVNGQLITANQTNKSGSRLAAGTTTYLGNRSGSDRAFDGFLDKHAMYSRLLTQAEIDAFHQRGILPASALVAYEMDEASGNLTDASGNSVTGTPTDVVQNVAGYMSGSRTAAGPRSAAGARLAA